MASSIFVASKSASLPEVPAGTSSCKKYMADPIKMNKPTSKTNINRKNFFAIG
jgi:hypothetical protein